VQSIGRGFEQRVVEMVAARGDVESHWSVNQFCLTMRRTRRSTFSAATVGSATLRTIPRAMDGRAARRSMTGVAAATTAVPSGEMRHVMVGFRWKDQCARGALMPFAVGTHVAYNVQRLLKPREPTARAAKGFSPPFTRFPFHRPR
jgi:hypothetical protein